MALLDIKADIASHCGANLFTDPAQAKLTIDRINDAAKELYTAQDLVGSLAEMIVSFDTTKKVVAFPAVSEAIRGMRWYNSSLNIHFNDIRPRYSTAGYGKLCLNFRELGYSPLCAPIENQSTLTFTRVLPETKAITLYIRGNTANSDLITEEVVFPAASLSISCRNNYENVASIRKSATTLYNIDVLDAESNVISTIPNHQLSANYQIIQIIEDNVSGSLLQVGVEILFKQRYTPLVNDNDEFICPGYDKAIFYKFLEYYYAKLEGKAEQRDYYKQKCGEVIQQRFLDDVRGKEILFNFEENKFYGMATKSKYPWSYSKRHF